MAHHSTVCEKQCRWYAKFWNVYSHRPHQMTQRITHLKQNLLYIK